MTYTPDIPKANDNISTSQGNIQTNFLQLEAIFANDHFTWDDATAGGAYRGYHRQVYFPVASPADPALGGFDSVLYSKDDTNDTMNNPQMYFRNANEVLQITNTFSNAALDGYVMLNGGLILMWGRRTIFVSGQFFTPFPVITNYNYVGPGFPNNLFAVNYTVQSPSAATAPLTCIDQVTLPTTMGFTIRVASNVPNTSIYWFAIGN